MIARASKFIAVAATAVAIASPGHARTFTIPLIVDFETARYADFHDIVAEQLSGTLSGGRLVVDTENPAGRCHVSPSTLGEGDVRSTFVDVDAQRQSASDDRSLMQGAGLAIKYSTEGDRTRFLAFLLRDTGYDIVAFNNGGIGQRVTSSFADGPQWPVRISARESGGGAEFFLNGERVGTISDSGVDGAGFGLIHCGSGHFEFDNWGQNTSGDIGLETVAAPAASAGGDTDAGAAPPPLAVWWVEHDGEAVGPISLAELQSRMADGRSNAATLVWREGMDDWAPAGETLP